MWSEYLFLLQLNHYFKVISLGANCATTLYINKIVVLNRKLSKHRWIRIWWTVGVLQFSSSSRSMNCSNSSSDMSWTCRTALLIGAELFEQLSSDELSYLNSSFFTSWSFWTAPLKRADLIKHLSLTNWWTSLEGTYPLSFRGSYRSLSSIL